MVNRHYSLQLRDTKPIFLLKSFWIKIFSKAIVWFASNLANTNNIPNKATEIVKYWKRTKIMRDHGYAYNFLLTVKIIELTLSKTFSASFSGTFLYKQLSLMSEIV
jgi:hypothetical protein